MEGEKGGREERKEGNNFSISTLKISLVIGMKSFLIMVSFLL